ncbi:hypothetical protein EDD86DRAFT_222493 [Gorgonomyces haynaldii]|nr:hypothetical protein EDD86DRAFT_222493 [Gorgonomyces haynaldii]
MLHFIVLTSALAQNDAFGQCGKPDIKFGGGLEGRSQSDTSFVSSGGKNNLYQHGSAQRFGIISQFICDRLNDQCRDSTAFKNCDAAKKAADAAQRGQATIDAFLNTLQGGNNNNQNQNNQNNGQNKDQNNNNQNNQNKNNAPATPPPAANTESSALPNGISKIQQFDQTAFCKQFPEAVRGNGSQLKTGGVGCSDTPIGLLMDINQMASTLIVSPKDGATFDASINNTVVLDNGNLEAGFFNNPNAEYYLVPQTLNNQGVAQGHQHVTMQKVAGDGALDPTVFAFFKGVNDAEVDPEKRELKANIIAGAIKENGLYRICTITGSDGHQPLLSPVVQRGPQDDCIRVNVINAAGGQNQKIADDNAQNGKITIDDKNSTVTAVNDNSGKDGAGNKMPGDTKNQNDGNNNNGNNNNGNKLNDNKNNAAGGNLKTLIQQQSDNIKKAAQQLEADFSELAKEQQAIESLL